MHFSQFCTPGSGLTKSSKYLYSSPSFPSSLILLFLFLAFISSSPCPRFSALPHYSLSFFHLLLYKKKKEKKRKKTTWDACNESCLNKVKDANKIFPGIPPTNRREEWKKVQDQGLGAPCREKPLEKSGLEPAAPNRPADRKHCAERNVKGELRGENECHIYVRVWAGEWCGESLSCGFPFVSEKIDQEETSMTRLEDKMGSQVTWPSHRRVGLGVGKRTTAGRSIAMRLESRVGQRRDSQLLDRSHALASSRAIAHVWSGPTRRLLRDLGSYFVIRAHHARFFLVDFLAHERELTGKTSTTPLTSPNPNTYVQPIFCMEFPFNQKPKILQ